MNYATAVTLAAAVTTTISLPTERFQQGPLDSRYPHQRPTAQGPESTKQVETAPQISARTLIEPDCESPLQQWLSFVPTPFEVCGGATYYFPALGSSGRFDVNGNGELDFVEVTDQFEAIWSGQVLPLGDIVTASELMTDVGGVVKARRVPVYRPGTALGTGIRSVFPDANFARIYVIGWRDMDGDGDLDLATLIQHGTSSASESVNCFFENIGFERPAPPVAGDINRDGRVDGADLGLVLLAWGPNP